MNYPRSSNVFNLPEESGYVLISVDEFEREK